MQPCSFCDVALWVFIFLEMISESFGIPSFKASANAFDPKV